MKIILLLLFLVTVPLTGFSQNDNQYLPHGVKFEQRKDSKSYNDCDPDMTDCPNININYFWMVEGKNKEFYNKQAESIILNDVYKIDDVIYTSINDLTNEFISDYVNFRKEYPEAPGLGWYLDAYYENVNDLSQVLSFELSYEIYTGGAHPSNYQRYYNYDYSTAKPISLNEIFIPDFEAKLNQLVESAFREENDLSPHQPLTDAGLFEDKIEFNDNFLLTRNGIIFHYNIYEIRAYVYGPTDVTVKYSDLIDLIDENGIGIY